MKKSEYDAVQRVRETQADMSARLCDTRFDMLRLDGDTLAREGDLMTISDFSKCCRDGCMIDDDGFFRFAFESKGFVSMSNIEISIRDLIHPCGMIPSWATHVVWFNK